MFYINNRLSAVGFSTKYFVKSIQNSNSNKSQNHENIRVHMLEIYAQTTCRQLEPSFFKKLEVPVYFYENKKMETSFLIIKKMINKKLKFYSPDSLISISGKIINMESLALVNYYPLITKFINHLMMDLTIEACFPIFPKPNIIFFNYHKMAYLETFRYFI